MGTWNWRFGEPTLGARWIQYSGICQVHRLGLHGPADFHIPILNSKSMENTSNWKWDLTSKWLTNVAPRLVVIKLICSGGLGLNHYSQILTPPCNLSGACQNLWQINEQSPQVPEYNRFIVDGDLWNTVKLEIFTCRKYSQFALILSKIAKSSCHKIAMFCKILPPPLYLYIMNVCMH